MYDASDIARVRELLALGWSKAAIAKQLRISRRVIYNWAAAGYLTTDLGVPRVRAGPRSKLHSFEAVIAQRLAANPAVGTGQILRELRTLGYTGELTQLRAFLAARRRSFVGRLQRSSSAEAPGNQTERTG